MLARETNKKWQRTVKRDLASGNNNCFYEKVLVEWLIKESHKFVYWFIVSQSDLAFCFCFQTKIVFLVKLFFNVFFFSFLLSFPSLGAIERQSSRQMEKQISTILPNKSGVGIGFHKSCPRTRLIYHPHGNQKNQSEAFSTNVGNGTFSFQITEFVPVLYYRPLSTDSWWVSREVISPASCGWTTSCLSMIPCLWWLHILSFLIWVQAPLKISRYSLSIFFFLSVFTC